MTSDDERMERAERIRRMREGQRASYDESGGQGSDDDEPPGDAESEATTGRDEADATEKAGGTEAAGATGSPTAETAAAETAAAETAAAETAAAETAAAETAPTEAQDAVDDSAGDPTAGPGESGSDAGKQEAAVAAQRAAQAAAQVTGSGGGEQVTTAGAETTGQNAGAGATEAAGVQEVVQAVGSTGGAPLPDQETLEMVVGSTSTEDDDETGASGRGTADKTGVTKSEEAVRVLEFVLGEERYCIDITYVEEIVKRESITRVPNTPEYVEGVVDLRGQITTILGPKTLLDIDQEGEESLIVVFDPEAFDDQGAIGWIVDEVRQVVPIAESEINQPPVDDEYINGVVDRDDDEEFVIWIQPDVALQTAALDADDE